MIMVTRQPTPPTYFESLESPLGALPEYSPDASPTEQSVALRGPGSSSTSEYVKTSARITLNLGPKIWRTNVPCYGRNGVIEGFAELSKLEQANKVDVTLIGKIKNSVTDRGHIVAHEEKTLVSITQNLYTSGNPIRPDGRYRFSIPIPTYVQGGTDELPPSFIAYHPRYASQVTYAVKVDMYRKGLRVHESVKSIVFYLPVSYSPARDLDSADSSEVKLSDPRFNGEVSGSVFLRIPSPKVYPASKIIPFALRFICHESPWLSQLLSQNVHVELVRYIVLIVEGKRSIRETILGRGEIWQVREETEGVYSLRGTISGGKVGSEYSWRISDMVDCRYVIRFHIPDEARKKTSLLPTFKHEEPITLTTHESNPGYDDARVQEMPCLGLLSSGSFQQGESSACQANIPSAAAAAGYGFLTIR